MLSPPLPHLLACAEWHLEACVGGGPQQVLPSSPGTSVSCHSHRWSLLQPLKVSAAQRGQGDRDTGGWVGHEEDRFGSRADQVVPHLGPSMPVSALPLPLSLRRPVSAKELPLPCRVANVRLLSTHSQSCS